MGFRTQKSPVYLNMKEQNATDLHCISRHSTLFQLVTANASGFVCEYL